MDEELKKIELNTLSTLMNLRELELSGKRQMEEHEKIIFNKLMDKYPSESFFMFNVKDGFFDGYPEYEKLKGC